MPAFRVKVRYGTCHAKPCVVFSTNRKERCVYKGFHVVLDSAFGSRVFLLHEGSWCSQGRTRLFGWMERARQRYVLACRSPRHLESSASRHTGLNRKAERRPLGRGGDHPSIRILHVRERSWTRRCARYLKTAWQELCLDSGCAYSRAGCRRSGALELLGSYS